jgi:hypothetical protein
MKTILLKNKSLQPETSGKSNTIKNKKPVTMKRPETKQPFKLNVLGLFTLDTTMEKLSFWRLILLIAVIMIFILGVVLLLKSYAIPGLGLSAITAKISKLDIRKLIKSRAP